MKLGVFSPVLASMSLEDALKYLSGLGVEMLELGCGGCPGKAHADVMELDKSEKKRKELKDLFDKYHMEISALSVHGNGVHPVKEVAKVATDEFAAACRVAEKLGVHHVVTFSGCPGDGKGDKPNWVTCPWPTEFSEVLEYQWNDVLIPYWTEQAKIADDHGVKICLELHPGFCCYNPETLMKLRNAAGKAVGANVDPSHLFWQGIDPVAAIRYLGDAVHYFHAKDTAIDKYNTAINGVLDTKSYADEAHRSWIFRSVGYGMGKWKDIASALRLVGYDHVMSIEHEDSLMTPKEGLEKAIACLKEALIHDSNTGDMWWI